MTSATTADFAPSAPVPRFGGEGPSVVLAIALGAVGLSVSIVGVVLSSTALAIVAGIVALVLALLCAWLLVARRRLANALTEAEHSLARYRQAAGAESAEASTQSGGLARPTRPVASAPESPPEPAERSGSVGPASDSASTSPLVAPLTPPASSPLSTPASSPLSALGGHQDQNDVARPANARPQNAPITIDALGTSGTGTQGTEEPAEGTSATADTPLPTGPDSERDAAGLARIGAAVTGPTDDQNPDQGSELLDSRTGLLGESYFTHALNGRVAAARRHLRPLALILMDVIEGSPSKSPTLAEPKIVAEIAQSTLRDADTLCRLADGRFAMILEDTPENGAIWTVERIRRRINEQLDDTTAWAGVACYPAHGFDGPEVLDQARRAITSARDWQQDRTEVAES